MPKGLPYTYKNAGMSKRRRAAGNAAPRRTRPVSRKGGTIRRAVRRRSV